MFLLILHSCLPAFVCWHLQATFSKERNSITHKMNKKGFYLLLSLFQSFNYDRNSFHSIFFQRNTKSFKKLRGFISYQTIYQLKLNRDLGTRSSFFYNFKTYLKYLKHEYEINVLVLHVVVFTKNTRWLSDYVFQLLL